MFRKGFFNHDLEIQVHICTFVSLVIDCLPLYLEISKSSSSRKRNDLYDLACLIIFDFETIAVTVGIILVDSHAERFELFEVDDFLISF